MVQSNTELTKSSLIRFGAVTLKHFSAVCSDSVFQCYQSRLPQQPRQWDVAPEEKQFSMRNARSKFNMPQVVQELSISKMHCKLRPLE